MFRCLLVDNPNREHDVVVVEYVRNEVVLSMQDFIGDSVECCFGVGVDFIMLYLSAQKIMHLDLQALLFEYCLLSTSCNIAIFHNIALGARI